MRLRRYKFIVLASLLVLIPVGFHFHGIATGADPPHPSPAESNDAAVASSAELNAWQQNIAEWKEWEPGEPADNSFCNVCHANLEDEKLVHDHLPAGVGCETCHGISDKHSEDEDGLVPPDVIFAPAKITQFCVQCHDKGDLIRSQDKHRNLFAAVEKPAESQVGASAKGKSKTCTQCHEFKHALKNRTRRWNKETRKLEWYDGVRMMQERDR